MTADAKWLHDYVLGLRLAKLGPARVSVTRSGAGPFGFAVRVNDRITHASRSRADAVAIRDRLRAQYASNRASSSPSPSTTSETER